MTFTHPDWLWGLSALPLLALWLVWTGRRAQTAVVTLLGERLADTLAPGRSWRLGLLHGTLLLSALALLLLALAGPRWGTRLEKAQRRGIDLVLALDTSLSMLAEDIPPNRLERAKQEMVDLIRGLQGDRVGVVAFAGSAYAVCPLTVDYEAALMLADGLDVTTVSRPGTDLAGAVREAAALFPDDPGGRDRAVILITDGESHQGDPVAAAREAAARGIRIYTIGVGSAEGELIPLRDAGGSLRGYKKDAAGQTVMTRLDAATLQQMAAAGEGKYLPATRRGLELKVLYGEIAGLHQGTIRGGFVARRKDRRWPLIWLAWALLAGELLLPRGTRGRVPGGRRILHTGALVLLAALALPSLAPPAEAGDIDRSRVRAGNDWYRRGAWEEALAAYREAWPDSTAPWSPEVAGVLYDQANALVRLGRYQEAVARYQQAAADTALAADVAYNRGNALLKDGRPEAAVQSYLQALARRPDDRDTRHNLELALRELERRRQQQQARRNRQDNQGKQRKQDQDRQRRPDDRRQQNRQSPDDRQQDHDRQRRDQQKQQRDRRQQSSAPSRPRDGQDRQPPRPRPAPADSQAAGRPDSTRAAGVDSLGASPQRLSPEDARRILQALAERERQLLARERQERLRQPTPPGGKDW